MALTFGRGSEPVMLFKGGQPLVAVQSTLPRAASLAMLTAAMGAALCVKSLTRREREDNIREPLQNNNATAIVATHPEWTRHFD